jgi:hypothetical protein
VYLVVKNWSEKIKKIFLLPPRCKTYLEIKVSEVNQIHFGG